MALGSGTVAASLTIQYIHEQSASSGEWVVVVVVVVFTCALDDLCDMVS